MWIHTERLFHLFRFRFTYFIERTACALSGVRAMLTFVQMRPIGLGIKNNLGSLYSLRALSFSLFSPLSSRLFMLPRRSFDELFAKSY